MRKWSLLLIFIGVFSCAKREYREWLLPGKLYVLLPDTTSLSVTLLKDGKEVQSGKLRDYYYTVYYAGKKRGDLDVYLPTGSGCAKAKASYDSQCRIVAVPDTPSTLGSCTSCDSVETKRETFVEILSWDRPVAVKSGSYCLQVYSSNKVSAFYVDSLNPGKYVLVVGGDTDTVFVSSKECKVVCKGC